MQDARFNRLADEGGQAPPIKSKRPPKPHPPATKKPRKVAKLLPKANDAGTNKESFDGLEVGTAVFRSLQVRTL